MTPHVWLLDRKWSETHVGLPQIVFCGVPRRRRFADMLRWDGVNVWYSLVSGRCVWAEFWPNYSFKEMCVCVCVSGCVNGHKV